MGFNPKNKAALLIIIEDLSTLEVDNTNIAEALFYNEMDITQSDLSDQLRNDIAEIFECELS
jgi:hypothetical protein